VVRHRTKVMEPMIPMAMNPNERNDAIVRHLHHFNWKKWNVSFKRLTIQMFMFANNLLFDVIWQKHEYRYVGDSFIDKHIWYSFGYFAFFSSRFRANQKKTKTKKDFFFLLFLLLYSDSNESNHGILKVKGLLQTKDNDKFVKKNYLDLLQIHSKIIICIHRSDNESVDRYW